MTGRRLALSVLVLLPLCAVFGAVSEASAAEPKAVFPELSWDAGDVRLGTDLEHDFVIQNVGDGPLHITEARPSCGCTVVDYPKEVPAGGQAVIKAKIKTKDLPAGRASKSITIGTDAENADRVVLQVKLNFVPPVEFMIQGKGVIYMMAEKGKSAEDKILVRPHLPGMRITGATSTNPGFEVTLEPAKPAARKGEGLASRLLPEPGDFWVAVKLKPDLPVGQLHGEINVATSDASFPSASFRVQAIVKEPAPPKAANKQP